MAWHRFSEISRSGTNRHNFTGDVEAECNAWNEDVKGAKSSIAIVAVIVKRKVAKSGHYNGDENGGREKDNSGSTEVIILPEEPHQIESDISYPLTGKRIKDSHKKHKKHKIFSFVSYVPLVANNQ